MRVKVFPRRVRAVRNAGRRFLICSGLQAATRGTIMDLGDAE